VSRGWKPRRAHAWRQLLLHGWRQLLLHAWKRPLLHFFAIGGLLFALEERMTSAAPPAPPALAATASAVRSDEELLYREARALGLHESDALVRRRLIRNMRFVSDAPERSDDELFREALALGMDESDLVVRRRLVQRLVLEVQSAARRAEPSRAELAAFLARHPERFTRPARVRLSHVFLSRQRRGAALARDAHRLQAGLASAGSGPEGADTRGDPLPLPAHLPLRSERELAATFGPGFARRVFALPGGGWSGPVVSSYGLHLVWIHEHRPADLADSPPLWRAVREALLEERAGAALRERLEWLRAGS
jgi:hypothetical protein